MSSSVMCRLCEASYRRRFAYFLIRRSWLMRGVYLRVAAAHDAQAGACCGF
jgi:hypothetical protein